MIKIRAVLFAILFTAFFSSAFPEEPKTIAVVGFLNQGDKTDDPVNKVISRSLITFLSKVRDVKVSSYEAVEKLAAENNYWTSNKPDVEKALDIGQALAAKRIVTGTYKINRKKETIQISVQVYDSATSELKLKRDYSGEAGIGIFDTIDKLVRNISVELAGHPVVAGKLRVEIDSEKSYKLYINDIFQSKADKGSLFSETEPAEEPFVMSLRLPDDSTVYRETITLKDGETRVISYAPSGSVIVRTGASGMKVFSDDVPSGETDGKGEVTVKNLKAGLNHVIRVEKDGKITGTKSILVEEGKVYTTEFGSSERNWFIPVHLLEGGLGGTAGIDYYFTDSIRATLLGGAVYLGGLIIPVADANAALRIIRLGDISLFAAAGAFCYFTGSPMISPIVRLEISWKFLFAEGGIRYGFDDGSINPMIGIGCRF